MALRDVNTHGYGDTNNIYSLVCGGDIEHAGIEDLPPPPPPCSLGPQGWPAVHGRPRNFAESPKNLTPYGTHTNRIVLQRRIQWAGSYVGSNLDHQVGCSGRSPVKMRQSSLHHLFPRLDDLI